MSEEKSAEDVLDSVSPARRAFVEKAVKAGFVLPALGSFTMSGLMSTPAAAQSNGSP